MCQAQPASAAAQPAAKKGLNTNVRLILVYVVLLSVYSSLVSNTPLAAYINLIRDNNNTSVGIATGIQGIVNLLIALPVGALADRIGRERLLRAAAVMALIAAAYTAMCLLYIHNSGKFDDDVTYYSLCGASALWGLFMGLHASPLEVRAMRPRRAVSFGMRHSRAQTSRRLPSSCLRAQSVCRVCDDLTRVRAPTPRRTPLPPAQRRSLAIRSRRATAPRCMCGARRSGRSATPSALSCRSSASCRPTPGGSWTS